MASCSWNISLYMYPKHTHGLEPLKAFFFQVSFKGKKSRLLKKIEGVEKAVSDFWWVARFSFDSKSHLGPYYTNLFYLKIFFFRALRKNHWCSLWCPCWWNSAQTFYIALKERSKNCPCDLYIFLVIVVLLFFKLLKLFNFQIRKILLLLNVTRKLHFQGLFSVRPLLL